MNFCVCVRTEMKPTDCGDILTLTLVPAAGQNLHLYEKSQHLPDGLARKFVQTCMVPGVQPLCEAAV